MGKQPTGAWPKTCDEIIMAAGNDTPDIRRVGCGYECQLLLDLLRRAIVACVPTATHPVVRPGARTCIQACDDKLQECRVQNCGGITKTATFRIDQLPIFDFVRRENNAEQLKKITRELAKI
jgi:hypothetical protein